MRRGLFLAATALAVLATGCAQFNDPQGRIEKTARYRQAESFYQRGMFVEAKASFLDVVNSPKEHDQRWALEAKYYAARCEHLRKDGNLVEAVRTYNELLKTPKYRRLQIRALTARADLMMDLGRYRTAARDYHNALGQFARAPHLVRGSSNIDREKLLFGEGNALWCMGRERESDKVFNRLMREFPSTRFMKEIKERHTKFRGRRPVTHFYVRVGGIYRTRSLAAGLARKVRARGFDARVHQGPSISGPIYTVRVGSFDSRQEAHAQQRALNKAKFDRTYVLP